MQILAVDTMKDSRDRHNLSQSYIDQHVDACAWLRPTHITVDSFMDWPDQFRMWVDSIRRYNVPIIFRLNWWGWQYYGQGTALGIPVVDVNAQNYVTKTAQFIQDNIAYFRNGDIFDACPEFEGGNYWYTYPEPRYQNPTMRAEYNTALITMFDTFGAIFEAAGLDIVANHCSHTSGSFTSGLINAQVADRHRWIAIDSYPELASLNPQTCVTRWVNLLNQVHAMFPSKPIFISEMGYSLTDVGDQAQLLVLEKVLPVLLASPHVEGINYWPACGFERHSEVFLWDGRRWRPRPAAYVLARLWQNKGNFGRRLV